jgi:serine/threonine-protein kinase
LVPSLVDAGLIHRDVKPANILVVDRGGISDLVKVVDFGLVKDVGYTAPGEVIDAPALTRDNTITGTPRYMSPETVIARRPWTRGRTSTRRARSGTGC